MLSFAGETRHFVPHNINRAHGHKLKLSFTAYCTYINNNFLSPPTVHCKHIDSFSDDNSHHSGQNSPGSPRNLSWESPGICFNIRFVWESFVYSNIWMASRYYNTLTAIACLPYIYALHLLHTGGYILCPLERRGATRISLQSFVC